MVDITQVDRAIRDGHKSMGREAEDAGRELALLAPKTMAAAVWGAAVTASSDKDVQALADRGALAAPFGVARCWAAILELAREYREPTEKLAAVSRWRGGRYQNQPAWVLVRLLRGAEARLRSRA